MQTKTRPHSEAKVSVAKEKKKEEVKFTTTTSNITTANNKNYNQAMLHCVYFLHKLVSPENNQQRNKTIKQDSSLTSKR